MSISANLAKVRERIQACCAQYNRDPKDVTLIAVSKTKPFETIQAALLAGQVDFGENYAQELRDKQALRGENHPQLRWHYMGRIQSNKAKYIAPNAYRIHTLESPAQAQALCKRAPHGIQALIAVNIGREAQKGGVPPEQVLPTVQAISKLDGVQVHGLMCIPPAHPDPAFSAPFFEEMAYLAAQGRKEGLHLHELSMGMSSDFEVAIRYGATWIRVGTAIFGARTR